MKSFVLDCLKILVNSKHSRRRECCWCESTRIADEAEGHRRRWLFHYAVMPPSAASESGKPSSEAKRFLDETTGSNKPRVHRNAVILLTPSRDGLSAAEARVRDSMAWELVRDELTPSTDEEKQQKGAVDVARCKRLRSTLIKHAKKFLMRFVRLTASWSPSLRRMKHMRSSFRSAIKPL